MLQCTTVFRESVGVRKAIVVGSGAGGATAAKELQGRFDVTILELGKPFRPFTVDLSLVDRVKKTGVLFDERVISLMFPAMHVRKADSGMVMVNGVGTGGTTTICTANALRFDRSLKSIGINLDAEFDELRREIPISDDHQRHWHEPTRMAFSVCKDMGLEPMPSPKMAYRGKCAGCGKCIFGCRHGAKWDVREFLESAVRGGAKLLPGCNVSRVVMNGGETCGVEVSGGRHHGLHRADLVVLAAGGLGTPAILRRSGVECLERLFVDPVVCVAAKWSGAGQDREIPMPFFIERDGFMVAPYFDYLSYFFNRDWKHAASDIYSIMIKLSDSPAGNVIGKKIRKSFTPEDLSRLDEGVSLCKKIFARMGKRGDEIFLGTPNAGHPGGMLPLTADDASTLHNKSLPENLYIGDSTLFPESPGNPPILTIMALSKKVSKACIALA